MECEYCGRFKPGKRFCSDECTAQDAAGYLIGKFEEWLNAGNSLQEGIARPLSHRAVRRGGGSRAHTRVPPPRLSLEQDS